MAETKPYNRRQKALIAINTALSLALVGIGLRQGDPVKTRTGAIKTMMQGARFARISDKIEFLKKIDTENLSFGMAFASIAMRAPQLLRVLQTGSMFARGMAGMICAAFVMQAVRPLGKFIMATGRKAWKFAEQFSPFQQPKALNVHARFASAAKKMDDLIYENDFTTSVLTFGPKVFMGMNAAGTMVNGYLSKDWHSVATGATYLAGIVIFHKAEQAWIGPDDTRRTDILGLKDYTPPEPPPPPPSPVPQGPAPL